MTTIPNQDELVQQPKYEDDDVPPTNPEDDEEEDKLEEADEEEDDTEKTKPLLSPSHQANPGADLEAGSHGRGNAAQSCWGSSPAVYGHQTVEPWSTKNPLEIDIGKLAPPLPPDGGWGWMIVLGSFLCMIFVDGMCFSYGIFLSELEASFSASTMKMTLAGSLLTGCYLVVGPVVSALANQFGSRRSIIIGSFVSTVSIFISAFLYNLDAFIVVFGVLGGAGYGFIYLPAATIVTSWFHKKRATATGIAVCGSGIGSFIYGFVLPHLIDAYTWRGCIVILSGINLNCLVAAALFRPIELHLPPRNAATNAELRRNSVQEMVRKFAEEAVTSGAYKSEQSEEPDANGKSKDGKKKKATKRALELPRSSIIQKTIEGKARAQARSVGSLDNMILTNDNRLIEVPEDYNERPMVSVITINRIVEQVLARQENRRPEKSHTNLATRVRAGLHLSSHSISHQNYVQPGEGAVVFQQPGSGQSSYYASVISLKPAVDRGNVLDEDARAEIVHKLRREIGRPMHKKDVFYSGSMIHINEYLTNADPADYIRSITLPAAEAAPTNAVKDAIFQMLDLSIMKSPTFLLLVVSSFFSMMGFIIPFQFLKDNAQNLGFSSEVSSYLLAYLGAVNTVGRVVAGLISDTRWADCLYINNASLIIAGLVTILLPFFTTYAMLIVYCCVFGMFIAAFVSLRTILIVEIIGLNRLTNAFGFLLLFQGVALIIGPPLFGSFYDTLKNFNYTFYLGGGTLALSGVMCFPLRMLANWEKGSGSRRSKHSKPSGNDGAGHVVASQPRREPEGVSRIDQCESVI